MPTCNQLTKRANSSIVGFRPIVQIYLFKSVQKGTATAYPKLGHNQRGCVRYAVTADRCQVDVQVLDKVGEGHASTLPPIPTFPRRGEGVFTSPVSPQGGGKMWVMVNPLGRGRGERSSGCSTAVCETDQSLPSSLLGRLG
jgi:hypothetical protein